MAEAKPVIVTDADFEEQVLGTPGIAVVDFWAPWCGPCHSMAPALEAFCRANAGRLSVFKLDVDDNPKTAEKYAIRTVPTLIFFRDGEPIRVAPGAHSETGLQAGLEALLQEVQPGGSG